MKKLIHLKVGLFPIGYKKKIRIFLFYWFNYNSITLPTGPGTDRRYQRDSYIDFAKYVISYSHCENCLNRYSSSIIYRRDLQIKIDAYANRSTVSRCN